MGPRPGRLGQAQPPRPAPPPTDGGLQRPELLAQRWKHPGGCQADKLGAKSIQACNQQGSPGSTGLQPLPHIKKPQTPPCATAHQSQSLAPLGQPTIAPGTFPSFAVTCMGKMGGRHRNTPTHSAKDGSGTRRRARWPGPRLRLPFPLLSGQPWLGTEARGTQGLAYSGMVGWGRRPRLTRVVLTAPDLRLPLSWWGHCPAHPGWPRMHAPSLPLSGSGG